MVVYTWNDENDLKDCLKEAIEKELPEKEGKSLSDKIRKSIGLDDVNKALNDPSKVERFQVLSPVKNPVWGTFQINSYFQEWVGINKNFSIEIAPITISALDKVIQLKYTSAFRKNNQHSIKIAPLTLMDSYSISQVYLLSASSDLEE